MYLVLCRKIHAVTDHHKGTAATACGYDQEHYVTFGRNVGQYPSYRYGSGVRSEQARQYGGVPDDMGLHGRTIIKTAYQLPYRNSGPEARMERLLVQAEMRDPSRIAKNALTNMVIEKAIDYPEPKSDFMQI